MESRDDKARRLLRRHRQKVFDRKSGKYHQSAIRRIKAIMTSDWDAEAEYKAGIRLERMGY